MKFQKGQTVIFHKFESTPTLSCSNKMLRYNRKKTKIVHIDGDGDIWIRFQDGTCLVCPASALELIPNEE